MMRAALVAALLVAAPASAGTVEGVIIDYGIGAHGGALTIRDAHGHLQTFVLADGPHRADGRQIRCALPPRPGAPVIRAECAYWPPWVRLGTTRVRVAYRTVRGERVTAGFTTVAYASGARR